MTYRGVYKDGVVVPSGEVNLPSGTEVDFIARAGIKRGARAAKGRTPARKEATRDGRRRTSSSLKRGWLLDVLKPVIGKAKGLPRDCAVNWEHYVYGVPKRKP